MKKVLIIAHDFPPLASIGALRPESWYNHFKEFNIYPIIVTRKWTENPNDFKDYYKEPNNNKTEFIKTNKGIIIKAPFKGNLRDRLILKSKYNILRKVLTLLLEISNYRFFFADNTKEIFFEADNYLNENKIDFILSTGDPWINFRYAYLLSKKYKIPWAADYRDGWYTDVSMSSKSWIYRKYHYLFKGYLEKKFAKSTKFISVSNPEIISKNIKFLGISENKFINVLNGYDETKINSLQNENTKSDVFKIGYSGIIYPFQRLDIFLDGIELFVKEFNLSSEVFQCLFIGAEYRKEQKERILNHNIKLRDFLKTTPRVKHIESLKMLKSCYLVLLLCNDEHVALPGKLFEYLGLEKQILVVKNDKDVVEKLIIKTNSGDLCNDANDVLKHLKISYKKFKTKKELKPSIINKEFYSRKNQAKLLAEKILKSINE